MEDLIMKKLIMFSMVLAIAVPALAAIEDVSPPVWGGTTPSANVVWQIDTEYGVPSCTGYDPSDDDPEYYFGSHEGGPTGTWDSEAGTFTLAEGDFLHVLVEVPGGVGANLTIRVQTACEGEPDFEETNLEIWASGKEDFAGEMATNAVEDPPGSGVWVQEGTFTATTGGVQPWFADAGNIIGILNGGPFTMTGMIIDVIRHDGDAPTSGPGRTICGYAAPAIAVDSNDLPVHEPQDAGGPPLLGPTEGQLLVSLAWQPGDPCYPNFTATVTVDPNTEGDRPHEDFIFTDSVAADGSVNLTFTQANWDVPQNVVVEAVADLEREGNENYPIELTVTIDIADPNFGNPTPVVVPGSVGVVDNDVPIIVVIPPAIEGRLSENDPCVPYCFNVTLSHLPTDDVYVLVVFESEYEVVLESMSVMDPPLGVADDPNKLTFTVSGNPTWNSASMTSNWNVAQQICLEARDDDIRDEGVEDAELEWVPGTVSLTPYSEDVRYRVDWLNADGSELPGNQDSGGEADETVVDFDVQDNECGALGYAGMDFNEDCRVGLGDFAHFYAQWLICTDPYEDDCDKLWNLFEE
jgi:hypothetical protein